MRQEENQPPMPGDYVILTAARNEEALLPILHRALLAQTRPPRAWVIAVNHSQDATEALARSWAEAHEHIACLVFEPESSDPAAAPDGKTRVPWTFAVKARALRAAYDAVRGLEFRYVGILDADMKPAPDCCERLSETLDAAPAVDLCVPRMAEADGHQIRRMVDPPATATWGAQLFRREAFESIGRYRPLRWGGIDVLAGLMVREAGGQTRICPGAVVHHLRGMGSHGDRDLMKTQFRYGIRDQKLGMPLAYCAAKALNRIRSRPPLLGSAAFVAGFLSGLLLPADPEIPAGCRRRMRDELHAVLTERVKMSASRKGM